MGSFYERIKNEVLWEAQLGREFFLSPSGDGRMGPKSAQWKGCVLVGF